MLYELKLSIRERAEYAEHTILHLIETRAQLVAPQQHIADPPNGSKDSTTTCQTGEAQLAGLSSPALKQQGERVGMREK